MKLDCRMKVLGLMSGSSLDGLDMAFCSFDWDKEELRSWQMYHSIHAPFPPFLKERLISPLTLSQMELKALEMDFTEFMIATIQEQKGIGELDLIGSHGHTIQHLPKKGITVQLGLGRLMFDRLGIEVVDDFRQQDIQAGGVGTPMAPLADRDLYPGHDIYLNLGGIANLSYEKAGNWYAYDLAPANQVLNHLAQMKGLEYDRDGELAEEGEINHRLLMTLLGHPYVGQSFPKSLDNNEVQEDWIPLVKDKEPAIENALHSYCHFLGLVLQREIVPSEKSKGSVFVTGGGTHNPFLIECLEQHNPNFTFEKPSKAVIDFKEACLIAYAAACRKRNKANFISSVTGASKDVIGGTLHSNG